MDYKILSLMHVFQVWTLTFTSLNIKVCDWATTSVSTKLLKDHEQKRIIKQIRTGCLPLEIELGCYRSPKTSLTNRICQLCNNGVGDETHLLLDCALLIYRLNDSRKMLLDMMMTKVNLFDDLTKSEKVCRILAPEWVRPRGWQTCCKSCNFQVKVIRLAKHCTCFIPGTSI